MFDLFNKIRWKERRLRLNFLLSLAAGFVLFHVIGSRALYPFQPQLDGKSLVELVQRQRHSRVIEKEIEFFRKYRRQAISALVNQMHHRGTIKEKGEDFIYEIVRRLPEFMMPPFRTYYRNSMDYNQRRAGASWALLCMKAEAEDAFSALRKTRNDPNRIVRQNAAAAFGFFHSRSALKACRKAIDDASPCVRYKATESLWRLTYIFPEARFDLEKAQSDPAPFVAQYARTLLKRIRSPIRK